MRTWIACFLGMICMAASAEIREVAVVKLDVEVEITQPGNLCAKAVAILASRRNISAFDAEVYLTDPVVEKPRKCLELVFSELGSDSSGYTVHAVGSDAGQAMVGVSE